MAKKKQKKAKRIPESAVEVDEGQNGSFRSLKDLKEVAFEELGETDEVRSRCLDEMKLWAEGNEDIHFSLPEDDLNKFLLRFLRAQKFDVRNAQKMLEKYLLLRDQKSEWFRNLDLHDAKEEEDLALTLMERGYLFVLPHADEEGRRVVFNWAAKLDPSKFTSDDMMRAFMLTLDTLLLEEEVQIRGLTYIFYCKDLTFAHCGIWSPSEAAKMFSSCEKSVAGRHRKFMMVDLPFGLGVVLEFVKNFVSSKIKKRIEVVGDKEKMAASLFPSELHLQSSLSLTDITQGWIAELKKASHAVANLEKQISIDSRKVEARIREKDCKKSSSWPRWMTSCE